MSDTATQFLPVNMTKIDTSSSDDCHEDKVDVALMERVKLGDHAAFETIVERHQSAIIGTVAKMLGNASEAEDIAQQVFIRLWKSAKRYKHQAKFTTFLFTITRNLVFNETRKKSRRKTYSLEEREESTHSEAPAESSIAPDSELLHAELREAVDKAIESLPEKQRLALILRRYENLSYEEIADITELSVSAVKSQLFRARTTLREQLSHYMGEE
ncbi:RNA polymerase, sigma subunit, ECF family [Rubritalea squalenifaciens DSM 18772]|uniref:RNA polymerase, sigma subunit, ECF family n=1 Tax=Rubritalea squalenifaciens DSM 18772 TaxID=1123071 RepID=A0A1M6IAW4_9BACT|nr:sigma-70 family RNA polymerase sigma factor [Rubritalea squalenifaciens]SHJ31533.1 RNA polymerase, sigma subunit, ECF family [Rubritalea squalenifaciens DSM 18772]